MMGALFPDLASAAFGEPGAFVLRHPVSCPAPTPAPLLSPRRPGRRCRL